MVDDPLLEALGVSSRVSLYLLEAIDRDALAIQAGGRGRTVGAMFAHLHNARLMWLDSAAADLAEGQAKVDKEATLDPEVLRAALESSSAAIMELVGRALAGGRIKGFTRTPATFVGYLIAHDSYHHGEIGIALGLAGRPFDRKVGYGMWEWGVR